MGRWACVVDLQVASIWVVVADDVAMLWGRNRHATNGIFRLLKVLWVVIDMDWMSTAEAA